MRKIWIFAIAGFGLVATAAIATLITLVIMSDDIVDPIVVPSTAPPTTTTTAEPGVTDSSTTTTTSEEPPPALEPGYFPNDFTFGAASSSYQIEGAWNEGGRSPSIWDTFVHNSPEMIRGGDTGDEAANSYHLFKEDVAALKATGVAFYRFSISWSRILPEGARTSIAAVDYYNSLIDELIANDIEPMVTMYHWDLPQYIQDLGGWTNELVIDYFDHYSDVLYASFGDRVKKWMTFNEPHTFCHNGYGVGGHAPGIRSPGDGEYLCGHHVLLAHARAYHNYKNNYAAEQQGEVGICVNSDFFYPETPSDLTLSDNSVHHMLGWFANPIFSATGNYPQVMIDNIKRNSENEGRPWSRLPEFTGEQIDSLKGSSDFFALNYYTSRIVRVKASPPAEFGWEADMGVDRLVDPSWERAKSEWLYNVPQGLRELLVWIKEKYNNPRVLIAENGYSDDGQVDDYGRIDYLREHLRAVLGAIDRGCNVVAYTVWSIIDNFEWAAGYDEKFGIYKIDFASPGKERIPKKSSEYFTEVIKRGNINDDFSSDFTFGAATSSYQIEGAWNVDGKSANIWDTMTHNMPDKIVDGDTGDEAADSYHRFREDVAAVKATGLNFYRFSISWSRILPDGTNVNQAGINYYKNLINELIDNGIEPMVTMYHWDLPQYIQDLGGWTNELVIDYFDHYSDVLYAHFGDIVKKWITFNEPYIFCHNGYGIATHAPAIESPGDGEYLCGHHVLLAHARAYHNYKNNYAPVWQGQVGICLYSAFFYPSEEAHTDLARTAQQHMLGWFANPIFSAAGNYPQVMIDNIKRNSENESRPWSRLPEFTAEEISSLRGSSDFLALNYYTSRNVQPKVSPPAEFGWEADAGIDQLVDESWPQGKSDFLFSVPEGLHDLLVWIQGEYNNPRVLITENGYSDDGQLQDDERIDYIRDHLMSIRDAISHGCNVVAYTVWSIIDNFEWAAGYSERFGIYHVNFTTKERTPKKSSEYLRDVANMKIIKGA